MVSVTVTIVQASIQFASALLYLWVARIILMRHLEGDTKKANTLFGVWWLALGIVFLFAPLFSVLPQIVGYRNLAFSVSLLNALLVLIVVAAWGLVYYLVYLYSGNPRWFWPLTAFYVLLAFGLLYLVAWLNPNGFKESGALSFEREQLTGAPQIGIGLLFSLPVVIAALAYGSLFFQVEGAAAKYRIGLVSGGFILQFGWSTLSSLLQLSQRYPEADWLPLVSNVLGVVAALCVLIAFRPPRALRQRFGLPEPGGT
ncbi:MAG: hypothetical protein WDA16_09955 [Candidatus Thermoplasmatota archaeon]